MHSLNFILKIARSFLCHTFAGAFLLPEKVVREEFSCEREKVTEWELKKLKGVYGTSMPIAFHTYCVHFDIV